MHDVTVQHEVSSPASPSRRRVLLEWFDQREPHPSRGPFNRWPRVMDAVLAATVFVLSLVTVTASELADGEDFTFGSIGRRPAGAVAMLVAAAAVLMWRRRRPVEVAVAVMAIMIGWAIAGYGDGQDAALVVAVYSVGRYTSSHRQSLAVVAAASAVGMLGTVLDTNQRIDVIPAIALAALPWYVGRRVRNRGEYLALLRERAERQEAAQRARTIRALADERSRIARELHDVVAHQVSMMTVQAGAAKTIARDDLDAAIDAMGDVEGAGRQALGELRHLLGVLRSDRDEPDCTESDDLGPQPGLADIPDLVEHLACTGATVDVDVAPIPTGVSAAVGVSVYRIVQESLTNVIRHAGPEPEVAISIGVDGAELVIDIANTAATTMPLRSSPSGFGIVGMRERASLLGGTLSAGPRSDGRFGVHARIPLRPVTT